MKKIQMVDLQTQYQNIKEDIDHGIQAVIDSASFIKGASISSFQTNLEQYTGAKHVIPVGNGTDALQIALMALGLKYGDSKPRANEVCERFLEEFEKENGSYICNDLLNCDISTEEGVEYAVENNLFKEFCPKMVESAAKIAEKIIFE